MVTGQREAGGAQEMEDPLPPFVGHALPLGNLGVWEGGGMIIGPCWFLIVVMHHTL